MELTIIDINKSHYNDIDYYFIMEACICEIEAEVCGRIIIEDNGIPRVLDLRKRTPKFQGLSLGQLFFQNPLS